MDSAALRKCLYQMAFSLENAYLFALKKLMTSGHVFLSLHFLEAHGLEALNPFEAFSRGEFSSLKFIDYTYHEPPLKP